MLDRMCVQILSRAFIAHKFPSGNLSRTVFHFYYDFRVTEIYDITGERHNASRKGTTKKTTFRIYLSLNKLNICRLSVRVILIFSK
jgi:hypothetical protein